MKRIVGVLVVIFALTLLFAIIIPDQRSLAPTEEMVEIVEPVSAIEIAAFNHIEYALLEDGRYLAILDPGGFEGERHGGALTIFDTLNGAVKERFDSVAGFAPMSLGSSAIIFSARTDNGFSLFSFSLEDGLTANLGIQGGQGGILLFENGEIYMSSNPLSRNYIQPGTSEELNYFGVDDWVIVKLSIGGMIDAIDELDFSLEEVYPKIKAIFGDDEEILSSNNVSLKNGW
jgi:hypothetical protein